MMADLQSQAYLKVFCSCHFLALINHRHGRRVGSTLKSCKDIPCNPHYFKACEFSCLTDRQRNVTGYGKGYGTLREEHLILSELW